MKVKIEIEHSGGKAVRKAMRIFNAAKRNIGRGGDRALLYAGRCEGIAVTLEKFGYSIEKYDGAFVAKRKSAT